MEPTPRSPVAYQTEVMSDLNALFLLWQSTPFQTAIGALMRAHSDVGSNRVLWQLGRRGAMRPSMLASEVGTGASNISKIVGRLEATGLVHRCPDPDDTRSTLVALTPAGESASRAGYEAGDAMVTEILSAWAPGDATQFAQLLSRFRGDIEGFANSLPCIDDLRDCQGTPRRQ